MCQLDSLWVDERVSIRKRYRAGDNKETAQSVGPAMHIVQRSGLEMFKILNKQYAALRLCISCMLSELNIQADNLLH